MGLMTLQPKRSIKFHHYNYNGKDNKKSHQKHQQRRKQKVKNSKTNMTIKYDMGVTSNRLYMIGDHNYSITTTSIPPSPLDKSVKRPRTKDKSAIHEIGRILRCEAERVKNHETRDKFDIECIQSFNEYARYLELVNPICSPEAVDTAEKLIVNLGMWIECKDRLVQFGKAQMRWREVIPIADGLSDTYGRKNSECIWLDKK